MFETVLRQPDWVFVQTETDEWKASGKAGAAVRGDVAVYTECADNLLRVSLTANDTPVRLIKLRWKTTTPLRGSFLGDEWERDYGYMAWQNMEPYRAMPWYFLVHREDHTAGYGVKVRPGALCFWQADPSGITLWLDVRCGGEGVLLHNRTLCCAEVVMREYAGISAFEAAQKFCRVMCTDPIFPPHPVYGSNNWYYAYGHSSEQEILSDLDYVVRLTQGADNPPYMVIDDCWQKFRTDDYIGGPWVSNEKFPDMAALAQKIVDKGARPGIWVRFLLDERSDDIPEEWRISHNHTLDPSHPAVLCKVQEDIRRICGWGYRLIKHDFSTFDIFGKWGFQMQPLMTADGWHFYDRTRTTAEIVVNFYRAILEAANPTGTLILGCNTIGHLGAGLMHMNRTGDDTSGILWERSFRLGVNTLAFRMPQHRTFYDVDADCVGITEKIPWAFNRRWAELVAKSGTSLFVSAKPGVLTDEENAELAAWMEIASKQEQIAEPLDWLENNMPACWKLMGEPKTFDWYEDGGIRLVTRHTPDWDQHDNDKLF